MRVVSLGSGSSGNALFVEAGPGGRTKLLVDAGLSARTLTTRLLSIGVTPAQLSGVLITHEHSDHVMGLPMLLKRFALPIMTDPRTYAAFEDGLRTGGWRSDSGRLVPAEELARELEVVERAEETVFRPLAVGGQGRIGDITITSFPIPHDAVSPCGYLLQAGGCRLCIVSDSGEVTPPMLEAMKNADLLILESNHDRARLLRGPYPYRLKQRILSSTGHLSNDQAAEAVLQTWQPHGIRWLWLSHLSRTNNTPTLALEHMRTSLQKAGAHLAQVHLSVLPPTLGGVWDSTQLWHASSLWEMSR
ncbi:MBL fold metallo-hydrolase [Tengunoibacter tsumagoiensis]|uniref:Metallo-hydrolase n=1 Tax=Tengunoibacter tsumagoiensis TaxID=2014871 RepID=A0A401ZWI2_9CHLR|nr:MBL fold metallo-hydrolase [Tengunoibacter tsumagoiensis]GCE11271.1 metallo-hydrolase [Tengunoibacter tsumagoiensis]